MTGSNRRPPACKAGALPAELILRSGDPYGIRTRVTAVKGRCLNHLTNGPNIINPYGGEQGIRTLDTLVTYTRFPIVLLRPARTALQWLRR